MNEINNIEKDFAEAERWFKAIARAVGLKKREIIVSCSKESTTGWKLLVEYLNPYNVYHVREKSLSADVSADGKPFETTDEMLSYFKSVAAVSNRDIARLKQTISLVENEDVNLFLRGYITKTLSIGISAETVNDAVGKSVIPVFGCMLAHQYFKHQQSILGKTIAVTEKLDGIRALGVLHLEREEISVELFSRQGQRIEGLVYVEEGLKEIGRNLKKIDEKASDIVFDGELMITDREGIPSKEQYKRTTKIVRAKKPEKKTGITYNVFDVISKDGFEKGVFNMPYANRRKILEILFKGVNCNAVTLVPIIELFTYNDEERAARAVARLVDQARAEDKEGVMLNVYDAPYVCKRTTDLLKVKVFKDCDLEIVGFQQGAGKYANTLGALIVMYKDNLVGVGSGITNEMRDELWNNQQKYLGRIATIQYFEETCDAEGNLSLRFPVFKELREIGKTASYE